MAEIVITIIAKLTEYLVDPMVRQGKYLFCADKIMKALETEKERLASTQDGVQTRVQEALNSTEKINGSIEKWLGEVKNLMDEVGKLEQQIKANNGCFQGRCPNWKRYRLCRQMAKKIETTKQLTQKSEFNPFSIPAPLPDRDYFSSGTFVYFHSTKLASNRLLEALQDDGSYTIGLYGMGGSGKTTLVKEVGKKAKELKLFDRVVFATVSQTPNVRNIQGEVADWLRFKLDGETESGRARHLSVRLNNGERILVILDDVWKMIDLKDIGISFEDNRVGCKVLLTTRRQQVCNMMDCKRKIHLDLLSEAESWMLFQKYAHIADNSLNSVAQEIARKCKGLPIVIKTVGISLKGKSVEEWKVALRRLRDSKPINMEPDIDDAFACLQLSYDYLNNKEAKSLFLMCGMYPEDEDISVEDLFRIAVGSGQYEGVNSLETARCNVKACINNLIDSCLLMHSEKKKDHLRMHDMFRDVALRIASEENHTIVVNPEKDMNVLAENGFIKDCYAFTSWCNKIGQIPQRLDAPKLEILLLKPGRSFELSEAAFGSMEALKVVAIVSEYYPFIQSMTFLTNLRTLRLQQCELGDDMSWVVRLRRLEILDLKFCSLKELPNGLEELNKLKLLDLSWCAIKKRSYKVIERCTQLEELYAFGVQRSKTTSNKSFSNNATFPKLQRYVLNFGNILVDDVTQFFASIDSRSKVLYLGGLNIFGLNSFIKDLVQRAEFVYLHGNDGGCKSIVPDMVQAIGGMHELTSLSVDSSSDLECLIDATSHHVDLFQAETLFPKLINLSLKHLANLKEVWRGPPHLRFFEKLQELDVTNCSMLTSLFPKSVVKALLLQKLTVGRCQELRSIVEEDGTSTGKEIIPISDNSYSVFSQLKTLTITYCDKLECVFSNSHVQGLVQLEEVHICHAPQLKHVFGQHEDEHHEIKIELPSLKSLKLVALENLLNISPKIYHSSCPSLKELHWVTCPKFIASCVNIKGNQLYNEASAPLSFLKLEKLEIESCSVEDILFPLEGVDFTNTDQQNKLVSTLDSLELMYLENLKFVWSGLSQTLSLQNLGKFKVKSCYSLKTIFSPTILRSLKQLKKLIIWDCKELEEIISDIEVEKQHQNPLNAHPPQLCFPNLKHLEVSGCNKLKCLFSIAIAWDDLPELQYLYVSRAAQLEQVFGGEAEPEWQNKSRKSILPNLRNLTLIEVPSLKHFCQGFDLSKKSLPQNLMAVGTNGSNCNARVPDLLPAVLNVKFLEIGNCERPRLESLPEYYLGSKLEDLRLENLPEPWLMWMGPSQISQLLYLRSLALDKCNKLKSVFSGVIHGRSLPLLKFLSLTNCEELEEIITEDKEFQTCFPKLEELWVRYCNKLKHLFSGATTALHPHLISIHIADCAKLEELFVHKSEASSGNEKEIVLPDLRRITLQELPSLVDVCKGFKLYAVNLESIVMSECPKFSLIVGVTGRIYICQDREGQEPLVKNGSQLLDEVPYFFNVREFYVTNCGVISLFNRQGFGLVENQQKPMALDLDKLELQKLPEPSFICTGLTSSQILSFQYLRILAVGQCGKLKCIFSTFVHRSLPELYYLEISRCEELEEIIAEFEEAQHLSNTNMHMSFPKLKTLEVRGCNKLKCLFWTATVGMLPKLRYIKVSEVAQLEELFKHRSKEGTVDTEEIVFPNLKFIKLEKLPSLTEVCKGLKLNAVNLSDVKINECPKLDSVLGEIQERNNQRNASSTESRDDWEDEEIAN